MRLMIFQVAVLNRHMVISKGVYLFSEAKEREFGGLHDFLVRDSYFCGITLGQVRHRLEREADLTEKRSTNNKKKCVKSSLCRAGRSPHACYSLCQQSGLFLDDSVEELLRRFQLLLEKKQKRTTYQAPIEKKCFIYQDKRNEIHNSQSHSVDINLNTLRYVAGEKQTKKIRKNKYTE